MRMRRHGMTPQRRVPFVLAGLLSAIGLAAALIAILRPFGSGQPRQGRRYAGVATLVRTGTLRANGMVRPGTLAPGAAFIIPYLGGSPISEQKRAAATRAATLAQAPQLARASSTPVTAPGPELALNLVGLDAVRDAALEGYEQDPPDQGLCANHAFVIEQVNTAMVIFHREGSVAPARSGTCLPLRGGACAWDDYAAAAYDAVDGSLWLATSYVAGAATQNENWATRVLRLSPPRS